AMNGVLHLDDDGQQRRWWSDGFIGGRWLCGSRLLGVCVLMAYLLERRVGADTTGDDQLAQKRLLRLFSRSTLFFDPALTRETEAELANPPLSALYFPSD